MPSISFEAAYDLLIDNTSIVAKSSIGMAGGDSAVLFWERKGDSVPYRYLEDIATSDVAFEAWNDTLEDLFIVASDATLNVMVEDLKTVADKTRRSIHLEDPKIDMLLFQLLQEQIFYKDAEQLLLRVRQVRIQHHEDRFELSAEAYGERLDMDKHELLADVKAVTLHRFKVERDGHGWRATVILDT